MQKRQKENKTMMDYRIEYLDDKINLWGLNDNDKNTWENKKS